MRYILDGYNVIFSGGIARRYSKGRTLQSARRRLLETLTRFVHRTRSKLTVVFDGGEEGAHRPRRQCEDGVEIVFSSVDATADDEIISELRKCTGRRTLTVVSDDNVVKRAARRARAKSMGAGEFLREIAKKLSSTSRAVEPRAKYHGISDGEVDWWRRFLQLPADDDL